MTLENKVVIITKSKCPKCDELINKLDSKEIQYNKIDANSKTGLSLIKENCIYFTPTILVFNQNNELIFQNNIFEEFCNIFNIPID